jgi:membrane peptidoglycan carboxypeptidase
VLALVAGALAYELRTSRFQAAWLSRIAGEVAVEPGAGPSPTVRFPGDGPYDVRYGYARVPAVIEALTAAGFAIDSQARPSPRFLALMDRGLSPIYHQKDQAGLRLLDRAGEVLFEGVYPERAYPDFAAIPPLVWRTLLFVEDRGLLDARSRWHNPAVNWIRLARAALDQGARWMGRRGSVAGASTLATQLEKFRHAPEGRTLSQRDKLRQMLSAALRAYQDGPETLEARRRIVTSYLNSMPLAGIAGAGEVTGLGDGLRGWFGSDFEEVNRLLREAERPGARLGPEHGRAYREVLHLLMAVQRPTFFLADSAGREALGRRADRYLDLLAREGVIPPGLAAAARQATPTLRARSPDRVPVSFVERKAVNAARSELLALGRVPSLYRLDRFDATARTGIDAAAQARVTRLLTRLTDPAFLEANGLTGFRLLDRGDPERVQYAFVLHERTPAGNVVRVQADNVEAPFSPIEGAKLELGSTAKLRTLVTYLEAVERAFYEETRDTIPEPEAVGLAPDDPLTLWVRRTLAERPGLALADLLEAAVERRYSASPRERFFTGGGIHTFRNFEATHDNQVLTVREAFRHSVNLVFIRMMRDIVQFHVHRLPGHPAGALTDRDDPRRREYLARFADREGRIFLDQFLRKHQWETRDEALETLVRDRALAPGRLAWAFRTVAPEAGPEEFAAFVAAHSEGTARSPDRVLELYTRADPARTSLVDRGFLAGIHPLELWLVEFRLRYPRATRAEVMDSSRDVRQEVYQWLFATRRTGAQDQRIRSILEVEAFFEIHKAWRRLGYPFAALVPSFATAIGSAADRPEQLAELVGILLHDGKRQPSLRVEEVRIAEGTPYETILRRRPRAGEQVLSPEVAAVTRAALLDVVENGTGRRAWGAVRGADGLPLPIGAKTGTGNNRHRVIGRGGRILEDRALNRTATLVFFVGDRFYGTLTAFVAGARADDYAFTSSLPAQIFRLLGPVIEDLAARGPP